MHLCFDLPLLFCLYNLQEKLQLKKAQPVSTVPVMGLSTSNHISFLTAILSSTFIFLIRKLRPTKTQDHPTCDLLDIVLTYPAFLRKDLRNCRNVPYFIMFILRFFPSSDFNTVCLFCITVEM